MRIGVFFTGNPQSGGLYQYSLCLLESLKRRKDRVIVFNLSGADFPRNYVNSFKLSKSLTYLSWLNRNLRKLFRRQNQKTKEATTTNKTGVRTTTGVGLLKLLVKLNRIDLLIFTSPSVLSFTMGKPYIMPVHDLQHRLNPQFPEVSADGVKEEREYLYGNAIPRAAAILVDSEIGREDVVNLYRVDEERVKVLPYTPPTYLRSDYTEEECRLIREKYQLPERFLFYPANFWRHKNHKLIIEALCYIKTHHGWKIPAVFVGAKQVTYSVFENVLELTRKYGIDDQIVFSGYVPNEDMGCLYQLAEALVMPTYFGPTNIPYLEAFSLRCPVIGTDIRGIREQIGDAGLLVNPDSSEDLAAAILKIWNDAGLRETLRQKGYNKAKTWQLEHFSGALNGIIDEVAMQLASA